MFCHISLSHSGITIEHCEKEANKVDLNQLEGADDLSQTIIQRCHDYRFPT